MFLVELGDEHIVYQYQRVTVVTYYHKYTKYVNQLNFMFTKTNTKRKWWECGKVASYPFLSLCETTDQRKFLFSLYICCDWKKSEPKRKEKA